MVIDLPERDILGIIQLIKIKSTAMGPAARHRWLNIVKKIKLDLAAQRNGGFYQCSACTDREPDESRET